MDEELETMAILSTGPHEQIRFIAVPNGDEQVRVERWIEEPEVSEDEVVMEGVNIPLVWRLVEMLEFRNLKEAWLEIGRVEMKIQW